MSHCETSSALLNSMRPPFRVTRGPGRLDIKEKRTFGLLRVEARVAQRLHQAVHPARIFCRDLPGESGMVEAVRRRVLDGQELAGIRVVLHVAVGVHEQRVAGHESAAPAGHVEDFADGMQLHADVLCAGRGEKTQRFAFEHQRGISRVVDDRQICSALQSRPRARKIPAWRSRPSGCSDNSAPAPWPCAALPRNGIEIGQKMIFRGQLQVIDHAAVIPARACQKPGNPARSSEQSRRD